MRGTSKICSERAGYLWAEKIHFIHLNFLKIFLLNMHLPPLLTHLLGWRKRPYVPNIVRLFTNINSCKRQNNPFYRWENSISEEPFAHPTSGRQQNMLGEHSALVGSDPCSLLLGWVTLGEFQPPTAVSSSSS